MQSEKFFVQFLIILLVAAIGLTACKPQIATPATSTAPPVTSTLSITAILEPTIPLSTTPAFTDQPSSTAPMPSISPTLPPAAPKLTERVRLQITGQVGGALEAFAVSGTTAYLGIGPRLVVLDVADPAHPKEIGRSELLSGLARGMAATDSRVYWLTRDAALLVLDVSNPARPRLIATLPARPERSSAIPGWIGRQKVILHGNLAYLTEAQCRQDVCLGGLRIVDISHPSQLKEVGFMELPERVVALFLSGNQAYVAHQYGFVVVDISNPTEPRQLASMKTSYVNGAAFAPSFAYLWTDQLNQLLVFDLSIPEKPLLATRWQPAPGDYLFFPSGMALSGDHLYIFSAYGEFGHCWSSVFVIDVSDLAELTLVNDPNGALDFHCYEEAVFAGDKLYVQDWDGLNFVAVANPARPQLLGKFENTAFGISDLAISDGIVFWGAGLAEKDLHVVDLRNPAAPQAYGPFHPPWATGGVVSSTYLFAPAWAHGLSVLDIRNPIQPHEVAVLSAEELGGNVHEAEVAGNLLYLATEGGWGVVDVSDPSHPQLIRKEAGENRVVSLALAGEYLYLVREFYRGDELTGQLHLLRLVDPADPVPVGSLELNEPLSSARLDQGGSTVFVAIADCDYVCSGSFGAVDVSDPANPQTAGSLEFENGAFDVAAAGEYALVAGGEDGLWVVEVSNPHQLQLVGRLDTPGSARRVLVDDRTIYIADAEGGLLLAQVSEE